jgi:hypothetical protein
MSPQYSYLKRLRRSVCNVILKHEKGSIFGFSETWRDDGRPQIMNDDEVNLFVDSVRKILVKRI